MTVPVRVVHVDVHEADGTPIVGAIFTAKLSRADIYESQVVDRVLETDTTDADGEATLSLFPNVLGERNTTYLFKVRHPTTNRVIIKGVAIVPDADCELTAILGNAAESAVSQASAEAYIKNLTAPGLIVKIGTDEYALTAIQGTENQVNVVNGTGEGTIVLSLPQDIAPASSPTFSLVNCTGLPVGAVTGLGANVSGFLVTPSSANLRAAVTDETGTGALVFANTPTLVTPNIGAATGTSLVLAASGSIDWAAGSVAIGASVGANTISIGGASTTVRIVGNFQVDGTTTTVNSTVLEVDDKNIFINVGGNDAASEGAGITVDRTGTDGSLIYKDASATKWAAGAAGAEVDLVGTSSTQTLTNKTLIDATNVVAAGVLGTAQATTSGTAWDYTSIPSWVKEITVMFAGFSTSGTDAYLIQIGDAGGFEVADYLGSGMHHSAGGNVSAANSTGFTIRSNSASTVIHGSVTLTRLDSATNTWTASGNLSQSNLPQTIIVSGSKALSAALTQVRVTTVGGTDTGDAGLINIFMK